MLRGLCCAGTHGVTERRGTTGNRQREHDEGHAAEGQEAKQSPRPYPFFPLRSLVDHGTSAHKTLRTVDIPHRRGASAHVFDEIGQVRRRSVSPRPAYQPEMGRLRQISTDHWRGVTAVSIG